MDDERLKNPPVAGSAVPDYFEQMLERVRDIRASDGACICEVLDDAGSISKKAADARAQSEYEQFTAQRRTKLESEGETANMSALLDAAKALTKPKGKKT